MKIMHGWWSLAYPNISLINLALSPIYLSTMALDTTCRNKKLLQTRLTTEIVAAKQRKTFYVHYCDSTKLEVDNYWCPYRVPIFIPNILTFTVKFLDILKVYARSHKRINHTHVTLRKLQSNWEATALASRVFPVPGGPYNKQPLGGVMPTLWNNSGFNNGNSITCKIFWNVLQCLFYCHCENIQLPFAKDKSKNYKYLYLNVRM